MQAVADLGQRQRRAPAPPPARSPAASRPGAAQISPTAAALSSVSVKSGRARRARSTNNSIASSASDSDGTRQRPRRRRRRFAAGRQHRNPGSRAAAPDQRGAGVEQVLAVVQHQQHLTIANTPQQRVHRGQAGLVGQAQRAGTVTGTRSRATLFPNCRRSEPPTQDRGFKGSGVPRPDRSYGIASAHCMCPSKPSDVAMAR